MSDESRLRDELCRLGCSLFDRGLSFGNSGNLSVRLDDGWLVTPTGTSLDRLDPAGIAKLNGNGRHVAGDAPSKEAPLHLAIYAERPTAAGIVHLHATNSVAVSCLADIDPNDVLPPITAYYVMRVGRLPLVPFHPPGDANLVSEVRRLASKHAAMLLANHGPVVAGASLEAAANAMEELEETAKLYLLLYRQNTRWLTEAEATELRRRFPIR